MKSLFVKFALCLLTIYPRPNHIPDQLDPDLNKCVKEVRPDLSSMDLEFVDFKRLLTLDNKHCVLACMIRTLSKDNTSPLTEIVKKEVEANEYYKPPNNQKELKDLLDKLSLCQSRELKFDCAITKCIDFSILPFSKVFDDPTYKS